MFFCTSSRTSIPKTSSALNGFFGSLPHPKSRDFVMGYVPAMSKTEYTSLGISMVKNESDIIEAFVRHNLAYVDLLVVVDNDSVDGTRDILVAMQIEGLPIVLFDDPIPGYFQSEKLTFLYRKIAPIFRPKLVYFLDADEFIVARSRESLEA